MLQRSNALSALRAVLVFAACCGLASASPILFVGANGNLKASALFENSQDHFTLTLSNVGSSTLDDADVLTGVFFRLTDSETKLDRTLTPYSAAIPTGSSLVQQGNADPAKVGENWAYLSGLTLQNWGSANQGVSSAGLGVFGQGNFCSGANCQNLDGGPWGLVYPGFSDYSGNGGLDPEKNKPRPFINHSVVLTFQPLGRDVTVSNVYFQYGTALGSGIVPGGSVPEPSALALGGIGLAFLGAGMLSRRRTKSSRS